MRRLAPISVLIVLLPMAPAQAAGVPCGGLWRGADVEQRTGIVFHHHHHHHRWHLAPDAGDPPRQRRHMMVEREDAVLRRMARHRSAAPADATVARHARRHLTEPGRGTGEGPAIAAVPVAPAVLVTPTAGAARPLGDVPVAPLE